jgi:hypothetical protein
LPILLGAEHIFAQGKQALGHAEDAKSSPEEGSDQNLLGYRSKMIFPK